MTHSVPMIENLEERLMLSCSCGSDVVADNPAIIDLQNANPQVADFVYETDADKFFFGGDNDLNPAFDTLWTSAPTGSPVGSKMQVEEALRAVQIAVDNDATLDGPLGVEVTSTSLSGVTMKFDTQGDAIDTINFSGAAFTSGLPSVILGVPADDIRSGLITLFTCQT